VQKIPLNTVEGSWAFLNRFPQEKINGLVDLFRREQPVLYDYVLTQNQEWFPDQKEGGLILQIAFFIWSVFRAEKQGQLAPVTDELLSNVFKERTEHVALLEYESELRAREIGQADMMQHPQFNLLIFVYGKTIKGHDREGEPFVIETTIRDSEHLFLGN
jgi:hypothetical protein